jgi:hypothetical protein
MKIAQAMDATTFCTAAFSRATAGIQIPHITIKNATIGITTASIIINSLDTHQNIMLRVIYLVSQWKRISRKHNTRQQHLSQLKASAFFCLQFFWFLINEATYTWDW